MADNVVQPPRSGLVEHRRGRIVCALGDGPHPLHIGRRQRRHGRTETLCQRIRAQGRLPQKELSAVGVGDAHLGRDLRQRLAAEGLGGQQTLNGLLLGQRGWGGGGGGRAGRGGRAAAIRVAMGGTCHNLNGGASPRRWGGGGLLVAQGRRWTRDAFSMSRHAPTSSREARRRTLCTVAPCTRRARASNHGHKRPRHAQGEQRLKIQAAATENTMRVGRRREQDVTRTSQNADTLPDSADTNGTHCKRDVVRSFHDQPRGGHASGTCRGPGREPPPPTSRLIRRAFQSCHIWPRGAPPTTTPSAHARWGVKANGQKGAADLHGCGKGQRAADSTSARRGGGVRRSLPPLARRGGCPGEGP